ncbi:hypothetical protein BDN72DRAFT_218103 [Pluteus cervinus]|uniref:Uncharacterized protein n=1 Tax=Pluteus cervinus TaxID=181527 RepID=A0ACD3AIB4_9AGAR|nr:hypothetical protein BDN72DRAFT_218103 [Pluteus cervinus]
MRNLLFHINAEPSSAADIARVWFGNEVTINMLVRHLRAVLVRPDDAQAPIQFRHKSFRDFLSRPSSPHSLSLADMNPVSKFMFHLRISARKASSYMHLSKALCRDSQWLGYSYLYCGDHPPIVFPYEEEAERLHAKYVHSRPEFRGCACLPHLLGSGVPDIAFIPTFASCGQVDCIIDADLLTLRQMRFPGLELTFLSGNGRTKKRYDPFRSTPSNYCHGSELFCSACWTH